MSANNEPGWFEAAWCQREEEVYVKDFGSFGLGICPLDHEVFIRLGATRIDPRWFTIGAFELPPTETRKSWVYVTSGLSNAWESVDQPDASEWSGLGVEFLIQCHEQSDWALALTRNLAAYQLLLAAGRFEGREPLDFWDRTAVGSSIDFETSLLKALVFVPAPQFGGPRQLLSGRFEYLQAIGLTAEEHAVGKEIGFDRLHERLLAKGVSPVINRGRESNHDMDTSQEISGALSWQPPGESV